MLNRMLYCACVLSFCPNQRLDAHTQKQHTLAYAVMHTLAYAVSLPESEARRAHAEAAYVSICSNAYVSACITLEQGSGRAPNELNQSLQFINQSALWNRAAFE